MSEARRNELFQGSEEKKGKGTSGKRNAIHASVLWSGAHGSGAAASTAEGDTSADSALLPYAQDGSVWHSPIHHANPALEGQEIAELIRL